MSKSGSDSGLGGEMQHNKVVIVLAMLTSAWAATSRAATFSVLHAFGADSTDGVVPEAGVIRDSSGNLYGTTLFGGVYGDGTIYRLDPAGNLTVLTI